MFFRILIHSVCECMLVVNNPRDARGRKFVSFFSSSAFVILEFKALLYLTNTSFPPPCALVCLDANTSSMKKNHFSVQIGMTQFLFVEYSRRNFSLTPRDFALISLSALFMVHTNLVLWGLEMGLTSNENFEELYDEWIFIQDI